MLGIGRSMTKERFYANSISPEPGNSAGFFIAETHLPSCLHLRAASLFQGKTLRMRQIG
ncbi:hypothetical protein AGR2A_Lc150022 [Agrobacterium genomosp. 2 str. CFBP 5494]|uniref:Uncharacterized protein n=1 Tax=Agrobacterium genomosp. 2 str. CFBP 5494 TaxID=1183436 RepID=A0A9W5B384_9HYPH|nr:hypothetical protein AGR2A_Lc150022 [Agrobacterium genomosp. 2 str. CFBP 5494]